MSLILQINNNHIHSNGGRHAQQHTFQLHFITGLCYGGWPLVSKYSGLSPQWILVTLIVGTIIAIAFDMKELGRPDFKPVIIGLFAGMINGVGSVLYSRLITSQDEASKNLPVVLILSILTITVGSRILFNEVFTTSKVIGITLGIAAIYFLTR